MERTYYLHERPSAPLLRWRVTAWEGRRYLNRRSFITRTGAERWVKRDRGRAWRRVATL